MPQRFGLLTAAMMRHIMRGELGEHLRLAGPLALSQLGTQLMYLVDIAMLGRYSGAALAGAGIAGSIITAITIIGTGIVMGMDTLVPQALGAGHRARARALLNAGVRIALLVAVPLTILAALFPLALPVLGVTAEVSREAFLYTMGRVPGLVILLLMAALRSYLQALGMTRPIMLVMVIANIVNVIANALLIFGDGALFMLGLPGVGLPALGSLGAAMATTLVQLVSLGVLAYALRRLHAGEPVVDPHAHDEGLGRAIFRLGWPVGLQLCAEVGIFALAGAAAGRIGTVPAAAHNVALSLASFLFGAALGVGAATSVRVGRAIGAHQGASARRAGGLGMAIGGAIMAMAALAFVTIPETLAGLFTNDQEVITAAIPLLRIAAVFQISDALQVITAGALRGAGDTRWPLWSNLVGYYVIAITVGGVLAFSAGYGAPGLWWGLSTGLTSVAICLTWRFFWLTASGRVERLWA